MESEMNILKNKKAASLIKINLYFLSFIVSFFIFDLYISNTFLESFSIFTETSHILFTVFWGLFPASFIFIMPKIIGRIAIILLAAILSLLFLTQVVYGNMFDSVFSFFNIKFAQEAMPYLSSILPYIPFKAWFCVLAGVFLMIFAVFYFKREIKNKLLFAIVPAIALTMCYIMACNHIGENFGYLQKLIKTKNRGNIAANFLSMPQENIGLYGFYQFSLIDLKKSISPEKLDKKIKLQIDKYIEAYPYSDKNRYSNIFKDKNLILVLIESGDWLVINESNTPAIARLMKEGWSFKNHFSSSASGAGPTFNAEFTVNSGFYSPSRTSLTVNDLANKFFPFSLPNLFKRNGYAANSFHMNSAAFYNRGAVHRALGYSKYYSLIDAGHTYNKAKNDTLLMQDDSIVSKILPKDEKFLSFIISYTGHAPYSMNGIASSLLTNSEKSAIKNGNEKEDLSAFRAQLRETDNFFALLIDELEKRNLLDNTVIIGFTDHYAYGFPSRNLLYENRGTDDPNFLNRTPFFVWAKDIAPEEITAVSTAIDIYPTIVNLFDLKKDGIVYMGTDIFDKNHRETAFFENGWYAGKKYYNTTLKTSNITSSEIESAASLKKLIEDVNNAILTFDYFRNK